MVLRALTLLSDLATNSSASGLLIFWNCSDKHFTYAHWFLTKDCNSGIDTCIGQHVGKGHGASMPSPDAPPFPHLHVLTHHKLSEPWPSEFLMEASSHRHDGLLTQYPAPLLSLEDEGMGLKVSSF